MSSEMNEPAAASTLDDLEAPSDGSMIEAIGLSKYYGQFVAIEQVSFSVPAGQVVAFLGPNGAGKSTTMKLLTGYLAPSQGRALIGGHDLAEDRLAASRLIGYMPEGGPLYYEMTPQSLLAYTGSARGLSKGELAERTEFVVSKCSLSSVLGKTIGKLSRGYKQRVGMAQALLHDPEVLILDEPTSGLDPNQVAQVRDLIGDLSQNKTILLSTHILREVQAMCDRVILINAGRIVFDGPITDLGNNPDAMEAEFRELTTSDD
jgi:ABC-2 type transport system ATP-binding protein